MTSQYTWEQSVEWLRNQPDRHSLVRACYYDDPLLEAAQRFESSEEWQSVLALLPSPPGQVLDLGAGRGISSYALAQEGWQVTAIEPDSSSLVGTGAISSLVRKTGLPIRAVEEYGEKLPFGDASFDLVYGRQVLHHAHNLPQLCQEIARVLRVNGRLVATREHVISNHEDLSKFLENHPLHWLYGGEHAYLLEEYIAAISRSELELVASFGPFDTVINYYPMSYAQWRGMCVQRLASLVGFRIANLLTNPRHPFGRWLLSRLASHLSRTSNVPGRLYSFVADK